MSTTLLAPLPARELLPKMGAVLSNGMVVTSVTHVDNRSDVYARDPSNENHYCHRVYRRGRW